jgi:hypothetical protein
MIDRVTLPVWYANLARLVADRVRGRRGSPDLVSSVLSDIRGGLGPTDLHGVWWPVAAWRTGLAGGVLAASVDVLAGGLERQGDRAWITREHVFSFVDDPVESFVAAMAWGFGLNGYGWYRTLAMFGPDGSRRVPALVIALRSVAGSPDETWAVLTGRPGLRGLGPAFGTKLAYFTGYDRLAPGRGPLIADR